jgi:MFS family permease
VTPTERGVKKIGGSREPGGFYGWWILGIAILIFAVSAVGQTQGFSVMLIPLRGELRIDPQALSLSFLVGGILGAVLLPFIGRLMDDRGVKSVLLWSIVLYAIALVALSLIPVEASALGALFVLRLVCGTVLWLGASVLVSLWFDRRRGFALGMFVGIGSSLLTLTAFGLSVMIESLGFTVSILVFAALLAVVVMPIVKWGIVNRPSLLQQFPDGQHPSGWGSKWEEQRFPDDPDDWGVTASSAYRTPLAWVITAAGGLQAFVVTGYLFNEAVIFMEQGATAHDAARSFIPQAVANTVTVLIVSSLVDRFRMRWMVTLAMAQMVLSLWWGYNLDSIGPTWLFALSFGVCLGLIFGYVIALFPRVYGVRHVGEIRGRFGAVCAVTAALGSVAFTSFDLSLAPVVILSVGALAAVISVISWFVPWPTYERDLDCLPAPALGKTD